MRSLIFTLMLVLVPAFAPAQSFGMTDAEAINVSGRQRMLSQRMMKSYLMVGAQIKADIAQRQLDESVALFESQFIELRNYAPSDEVNAKLDQVEVIWLTHREKILARPGKGDAPPLMQENLMLLNACNEVVKEIEAYSGIESGKLVNMSGRQRMLSQKIAKAYVAIAWNVSAPNLEEEFAAAIQLFDESLSDLEASDMNTEELKLALIKVRNQWRFSQSGFRLGDYDRYVPTVITVTTDSILRKMNDITGQYAKVMESAQMMASDE
jgi:hypothetical protein